MLQSMASFYFAHIGVVWIDIMEFWFGYGCWFTVGSFANCGGLKCVVVLLFVAMLCLVGRFN